MLVLDILLSIIIIILAFVGFQVFAMSKREKLTDKQLEILQVLNKELEKKLTTALTGQANLTDKLATALEGQKRLSGILAVEIKNRVETDGTLEKMHNLVFKTLGGSEKTAPTEPPENRTPKSSLLFNPIRSTEDDSEQEPPTDEGEVGAVPIVFDPSKVDNGEQA